MLLSIADLLNPAELAQARAVLASAAWIDGRHSAGTQAAQVKNNQQLPVTSDAAKALGGIVLGALDRSAPFFSAALPKRVLPPMFNRYAGGHNHYGNHVDQAIRYPAGGERMRTDLSCTLFLSSPDDYDGGELVVEDVFGPREVKLPAGHLVLYPGNSVHRVQAVTRGARLASFFWVESLVRCHEQRRLLHDLDRNLMRLRERHGESPETVALTGTYHNLLRLWADT
jgi:PKHD-type hydroxylase